MWVKILMIPCILYLQWWYVFAYTNSDSHSNKPATVSWLHPVSVANFGYLVTQPDFLLRQPPGVAHVRWSWGAIPECLGGADKYLVFRLRMLFSYERFSDSTILRPWNGCWTRTHFDCWHQGAILQPHVFCSDTFYRLSFTAQMDLVGIIAKAG
jgi:hypothetical protein